ncbi:hypothetical protein ZWY2020_040250 [Hordeum vulgare]|nr:hypothetical protein ZWY2020_040250 [Hordeum vulgare]
METAATVVQGYPAYTQPPPTLAERGDRHVGVPSLTPALRNERMPKDSKGPRKVPNYTPDLEPGPWIKSYELAMDMLDVNEAVYAKYFTMMLEGTARTWLKNLSPNSINTWAELKECFVKNFRGTCKHPMTIVDLQHCVQHPDESADHWTRRVAEVIYSSDGISAAHAMLILEKKCHYEPLVLKLGLLKRKVQDMGELMDTLTRYAESDDTKDPGEDDDKGVFQQPPPQGDPQRQDDNGGFQNNPKQLNSGQYHVFTTNTCKRGQKVKHRAFSVVEPALPRYLNWSGQHIIWSREDHTPRVDNPGDLALVVAPQVGGYTLYKVLMDGGSSINILYFDTIQRMNFSEKDLMPSSTVFHGIVPGKSAYPVGRIKLNVAFGTASNYRSESLMFEVVNIKSPYHALFRRPSYARFMARPCYVYLKLKIPGPKGTITINGDRKIDQECEEGDAAYAESACAAEELKFHQANVDPADMTPLKRPTIDSEPHLMFKLTDDTKVIDFTPGNSTKQFTIGTGLDPK